MAIKSLKKQETKTSDKKTKEDIQDKGEKFNVKVFFEGVKSEWGKIKWPTKDQVIQETLVVIVVTAFFTGLVTLIDIVYKLLIGLINPS